MDDTTGHGPRRRSSAGRELPKRAMKWHSWSLLSSGGVAAVKRMRDILGTLTSRIGTSLVAPWRLMQGPATMTLRAGVCPRFAQHGGQSEMSTANMTYTEINDQLPRILRALQIRCALLYVATSLLVQGKIVSLSAGAQKYRSLVHDSCYM